MHQVSSEEVEAFRQTMKPEDFLTPYELWQYQAMTSPDRKRDFFAGRLAAKNLLRQWTHQKGASSPPWTAIGIRNLPPGVPKIEWVNYPGYPASQKAYPLLVPDFSISIAHCEGNAVAALSPTLSVGVDIQRIRPIPSRYIHRLLTPGELVHLHRLNPEEEWKSFYDFWVLKEAVAKALHIPLYTRIHDIEIYPRPSAETARLKLAPHLPSTETCHLILKHWNDYKIAFCACSFSLPK